jgi:hypothetical protein
MHIKRRIRRELHNPGANPTTFEFTHNYNASVEVGFSMVKETIFVFPKRSRLLVPL